MPDAMSDALRDAFGLEDRVAVVTGAASGIGRAVAEVFAQAGARVVLGDLDADGAEATVSAIREDGGEAIARVIDVSQRSEVDAMVEAAVSRWGQLDVMCNVAGIPSDGPLDVLPEAEFDRVMAINVKGTLFGCQAAIRAMAPRKQGSIINVASAAIDLAVPNYGLYAMTKSAVAQLTQTLAVEVGERGIRVNTLAPGATVTQFTQRHMKDADGTIDPARLETFLQSMRAQSPLGIVGEAIDQAWLALYLASDASRFCTGQVWRANGGAVLPR